MIPRGNRWLAHGSVLWLLLAPALVVPGGGCQRDAPAGSGPQSASQVLEQMVEKYKNAQSYEDVGQLHLAVEGVDGAREQSPPLPFSVAFERPNKIRIHSFQASIVADGERLRASADALENQVLAQPCPQRLSREGLLSDPLLAEAARGQIDVVMPQLALLLESDALAVLSAQRPPTYLSDEDVDSERCHRVAVAGPQGTSVFWISAQDGLLRKLEFASDALAQKFQVAKCSLWAEFKGARLNTPIASAAFQFAVPEGANLLKRLLPPPPALPAPLLAKLPDDFTFIDLDGAAVSRDSLKDKVVVLDMWATWCGWCFKGLPNLEQVRQRYKHDDRVVILAVNKDVPTVSDAKVRGSFASAQLSIPIVRDASQSSDRVFGVKVLPTMIVLAADGTVQDYHVGYDAELAETLPQKIDKLLAGENLAQRQLEEYQRAQQEYDEKLGEALVTSVEEPELPEEEIARKDGLTE